MTVLASTHKVFSQGIHQSWTNELLLHQNLTSTAENAEYSYPPLAAPMHAGTEHGNNNIFRSVQWTSDGSSLVTCSEDNCIRLFIPPQDLLSSKSTSPLQLTTYSRLFQPSSIISHAIHNQFSLQDFNSCISLVSIRDSPIHLYNLLTGDLLSSFPLLNQDNNEIYNCANSMIFKNPINFITGSKNLVSIFDINHNGEKAFYNLKTNKTNYSTGNFKGIISSTTNYSFDSNLLFIGNYNNQLISIDLNSNYDDSFVSPLIDLNSTIGVGNGITQTLVSKNGRYLYVITRKSNEIMILDIRMNLQQCGKLSLPTTTTINNSKFGLTNQRMKADILSDSNGLIWGDINGNIQIWSNSELGMDSIADKVLEKSHDSPVSCVSVNPEMSDIIASCSGTRFMNLDNDSDSDDDDNYQTNDKEMECSVKLWKLNDNST